MGNGKWAMPSFSGTVALAMIDWLVEGQEKKPQTMQ